MGLIRRIPFGLVCVMAVAGCLATVAMVISLAANWPYQAEKFAGRIDPLRVWFAAALLAGMLTIGLLGLFAFAEWRSGAGIDSLGAAIGALGLFIATGSVAVLLVTMPPVSTVAMPLPLRIPLFLGVGLLGASLLQSVASGVVDAVKRGDRRIFVALILLAGIVAISLLRRP